MVFSSNNTLCRTLATRQLHKKCKYDNCGIYQITCPACNKKYTGQTPRSFKIRFQEHLPDFKYGNGKSIFAQHLVDNGHPIQPVVGSVAPGHRSFMTSALGIMAEVGVYVRWGRECDSNATLGRL